MYARQELRDKHLTVHFSFAHRHAGVALNITEKLLSDCDQQRIQLIVDSYLDMLHTMLESLDTDLQIMATSSVSKVLVTFSTTYVH